MGGATLLQRTLSLRFKELVTFYACDLYWPKAFSIDNPNSLTIKQIVDDRFSVIDKLKLQKIILVGHSSYGLTALAAAKREDPRIKGIIMIGPPTNSSREVAEYNDKYFQQYACNARKENDKNRKKYYAEIKKPEESEISLNAYESCSARYWGDFNIPREFLEKLWDGVEIDDNIANHFWGYLLQGYNSVNGITEITVSVILFGGQNDYDCLPLELWKNHPQPPRFTIIGCGEVGHWPHFENAPLFDTVIEKWLKDN